MTYYTTTEWLNLRNAAEKTPTNVLAIMPPATVVKQTGQIKNGWVEIEAVVGKHVFSGWASIKYLELTEPPAEQQEDALPELPEAHLRSKRVISVSDPTGRVFPLNERTPARADLRNVVATARKQIIYDAVDYLNVQHSARYAPGKGLTYCNIYATDLAYCTGLYIPRVWWTDGALKKIMNGAVVEAVYEKTVTELNANSLADWFEVYGNLFGWRRVKLITELQTHVNAGTLGIIVGQRTDLNRSGHIVGVVPEDNVHKASRDKDKVLSPLQTQAGLENRKYFTGNNWWQSGQFRKFGYWVWEGRV